MLTAERDMREKQAADLRSKLGEMNQDLIDVKKKYFAQVSQLVYHICLAKKR